MPVAVLAMWPFIFDASFTLARRLLRGENIFQAHRSHLYQRLVVAGWSHRMTSLLYGSLAALSAVVAISPLLHPGLRLAAEPAAFAVVATSALVLPGLAILTERCRPSTPTS